MLFKSCALLLIAVALVLAQDAEQPTRQRTSAASRRTKLFEEQQQQQAEKVTAAGQRRRLVSKTRVGSTRTTTTTAAPTTAAPTTVPPTEPTIINTEPTFVDEPAEEQFTQQVEQEEPEQLPAFRPRPPVARPAPVQQEVESELPPFRPKNRRPQPVVQKVVVVEEEEEEPVQEEEPQPIQVVRQRPLAGPTRTRAQAAASRPVEPEQQSDAPALSKPARTRTSVKDREEAKPVVETVRRYSFEGEDGSFTFGYENADGSFKEETRGADCIVRGKYGYIDPDGIKREFNYQTGNQCVPGEEKEEEVEDDEEEDRPAPVRRPNVPQRRPNVPIERRPNIPERRPAPVVVQQQEDTEEEEREVAQVLNTPTRISRPTQTSTPQRIRTQQPAVVNNVPETVRRPAAPVQSSSLDIEAEVQRLSGSLPVQQPQRPAPRPAPARPIFNDEDDADVFVERRPFQQQVPVTPIRTGQQSFSTELVFDRNNNQFQTALQQRIPETNEEISIREKLGGFVFNPQTTTTPSPTLAPVVRTPFVQPSPFQADFDAFGPTVAEQERIRQLQETRRQQQEAERIKQEQQRIAEENANAQRRPAVPVQPQPQQDFRFQQPAFAPLQPFRPQQPQFIPQSRPLSPQQGQSFASGQIDQFLSSLG